MVGKKHQMYCSVRGSSGPRRKRPWHSPLPHWPPIKGKDKDAHPFVGLFPTSSRICSWDVSTASLSPILNIWHDRWKTFYLVLHHTLCFLARDPHGILLLPCLLQTGVGVMRKSPQQTRHMVYFQCIWKSEAGHWFLEFRVEETWLVFSVMICRKENIIQQRGSRPRIYLASIKILGVKNDQFKGLLMLRFQLC